MGLAKLESNYIGNTTAAAEASPLKVKLIRGEPMHTLRCVSERLAIGTTHTAAAATATAAVARNRQI